MKTQIVIDTDVGSDVDDLFALTYALRNPNVDVKTISTVIGDTVVRLFTYLGWGFCISERTKYFDPQFRAYDKTVFVPFHR